MSYEIYLTGTTWAVPEPLLTKEELQKRRDFWKLFKIYPGINAAWWERKDTKE